MNHKQELTPLAKAPASIIAQVRRRQRRGRRHIAMQRQKQELQQHGSHESVEWVKVAESEEEEERRKSGEGRDEDRHSRPVLPAAYAKQRKLEIEHADGYHRASQGDAVVRHEGQQPRVDILELLA